MNREVRCFESFDDADRAEGEYYAALTPAERVEIVLELVLRYRESLGEAAERFERVHRIVELSRD